MSAWAHRTDGRGSARATVVAIGASTGGPAALARVLSALPADYRLPVLVAQHMGADFVNSLMRTLAASTPLPVRIATDGQRLGPGVWLAPAGADIELAPHWRLATPRSQARLHASVDALLASVARGAGSGAVGVVLTGMGNDGAAGVTTLRAAGARTIAQAPEGCAVFGMPKAAAAAGAGLVLELDQIGPHLAGLGARRAA